ncbi:hypothetical protein BD310DRAFT_924374 [Dichomitus squalens]|uniref:Uncharacterized protein n=1 Tax=Dichomitus squalens TaxID=114155 RepID=A0A4Q9P8Q6_9APHY|nr:hypothetical protein BD310DRAFT_942858 [Dichomitus squalens]TBU59658.1 hypothetical protein BD310DRAFT_924374 [Dichomitus squalens]
MIPEGELSSGLSAATTSMTCIYQVSTLLACDPTLLPVVGSVLLLSALYYAYLPYLSWVCIPGTVAWSRRVMMMSCSVLV